MKESQPTKSGGVSTRWLILATTVFFVAVTLAPPLQRYFAQRAQIDALSAQVKQSNSQLKEAQKKLSDLNDPTFIASQARSRLHYIFPGEQQYIVIGLQKETPKKSLPAASITSEIPSNQPWYERFISTLTSTTPSNPLTNQSQQSITSTGGNQ
jgi:cell division protein FtsB